jgi:hypothetical protein
MARLLPDVFSLFMPVVGETSLPAQGGGDYCVMLRHVGCDWSHGVTVPSAREAMLHMNVIRRMKPELAVKVARL